MSVTFVRYYSVLRIKIRIRPRLIYISKRKSQQTPVTVIAFLVDLFLLYISETITQQKDTDF